ncbi:penicillin-binding protein 2 [Effusibacillus dendaii]|uniref:Penicillin-binding protein 2 n=1 Tax=Effusibacillus dendaii TaxID=2743772 RepID=A0A7I8D8E2_9BACL|nr:penicillin-binding protein 2 [Effusibacillus dendaii]BCJ85076.1 penicillin-binding protein 2 [Effusibacillus dendaii]
MLHRSGMRKTRWFLLKVVVVAAFVALLLRLFAMQVTHGTMYRAKIERERIDHFPLTAPRGQILDRTGTLLARNVRVFNLIYLPVEGRNRAAETARLLAPILGKQPNEVLQTMDVGEEPKLPFTLPRRLAFDLNPKQTSWLLENQDKLPGLRIIVESKREYPQKRVAAHILGYLNSIPPEEWDAYRQKGYSLDAQVGVYGLEKQYESFLKGRDGALLIESNGNPGGGFSVRETASIPGHNLIVSLDLKLQSAVEKALREQVQRINSDPKKKKVSHAAAVAIQPQTGDVLAIASYPGFDPNIWVGGISPSDYRNFQPAQQNWALQVPIPPGSTVKPLTLLMALEKGIVSSYQSLFDQGRLQIGWETNGDPHYFYCWDHSGHGDVDARKALAVSCNVYMYQLSLWLGNYSPGKDATRWLQNELPMAIQYFRDTHRKFGLGVPTGVDLGEEVKGRFQTTGQLADLPFAAIGQNQAYTAMQLAQYVGTLATGGKRMEPHVVKEIRAVDGKLVKRNDPKVLNEVSIRSDWLQTIREGMRDAVNKPYGTAYSTFLGTPYTAAGKTGTAETGRGEDNALFVGYAPFENPQIAIAVIVPEGGHGSDSSVPIARKIFDAFFSEGKNR